MEDTPEFVRINDLCYLTLEALFSIVSVTGIISPNEANFTVKLIAANGALVGCFDQACYIKSSPLYRTINPAVRQTQEEIIALKRKYAKYHTYACANASQPTFSTPIPSLATLTYRIDELTKSMRRLELQLQQRLSSTAPSTAAAAPVSATSSSCQTAAPEPFVNDPPAYYGSSTTASVGV